MASKINFDGSNAYFRVLFTHYFPLLLLYHIAGNFRGRKLSQISRFWGMPHPLMFSFKQSMKVFSMKFSLPTDPRKFSPSKVYHYMNTVLMHYFTLLLLYDVSIQDFLLLLPSSQVREILQVHLQVSHKEDLQWNLL